MYGKRLDVSPALLGAALYFSALFGGWLCTFALAALVLFCENDPFVRKAAVKAPAVMALFSLLSTACYLLPDAVNVIHTFVSLFGGSFHLGFLSALAGVLATVADFARKLVLLWLGLQALGLRDGKVPVVDKLLAKFSI